MSDTDTKENILKKTWPLWVIVFVIGIFMVFFRIGNDAIWYDESYSVAAAQHPVGEIIMMIGKDSHPPLYYILLRGVILVFGHSLEAVRSLSALGIIGLALLGFFPLRKMIGEKGGLAFSVMAFVTPMSIVSAHEARMYSLTACFVTATLLWGYLAWRDNRKRDWLLLGLFTLAAAYTHYYGLIAVGMYWLILLIAVLLKKDKKTLICWLISAAVVLALYTPWFFLLAGQASRVNKNYWIQPIDAGMILRALSYPFVQKIQWVPDPLALLMFVLVSLVGIAGIVMAALRKEKIFFLPLSGLLVFTMTFLAALVLSKIFRPILVERYMISCMGVFLLGAAFFIGQWKKWWISAGALLLYALSGIGTLAGIYKTEVNGPMDIVYEELKDLVQPEDVFVHGSEHNMGTFSYYFPDNRHYLYIPKDFVPFSNYEVFSTTGEYGSDFKRYNEEPVTIWATNRAGEFYSMPFSLIFGAPHRKLGGPVKRYSKAPGWYSVSVQKIEYDPNKTVESSESKPVVSSEKGTLTVVITGIKQDSLGTLHYGLYTDDPIPSEDYARGGSEKVNSDSITITFKELPLGTYAFTGFIDSNNNDDLDFDGNTPIEGLALSLNGSSAVGKPDFSMLEFPFQSRDGEIRIEMLYY